MARDLPRPKALRGRGQDRKQKSIKQKEANKGSSQPPQVVPEVRRGPPQISPAAQEQVVCLQSAAMGDDNSSEAKMLRDVLQKAQQEATSAPRRRATRHLCYLSREPGTVGFRVGPRTTESRQSRWSWQTRFDESVNPAALIDAGDAKQMRRKPAPMKGMICTVWVARSPGGRSG